MSTIADYMESDNLLWFKDAIVYEMHVRSFKDSSGNGIGDFRGAISKLDYLEELGVNAIWLQPFYPSPMRDDGYDVSDYTDIHPDYGTLADFKEFLKGAHSRDIRVIVDLVLNHTSDKHPWFQRARSSRKDSKYRNFYVWNDSREKYKLGNQRELTKLILPTAKSTPHYNIDIPPQLYTFTLMQPNRGLLGRHIWGCHV